MREIGDVVFTTPAIRALREHFPAAHLSFVVEPHAAPVVEHNPHLNDVVVAPRRRGWSGLAADVALGRSLRRRGFDLAIDFHGGPRASLLTWLSGARERIGYEIAGRGWMYTTRVARPRALRPRHSVENQWDLLTPLGIAAPDPARHPVEMPPDRQAVARVEARLALAGVAPHHRLAVIHVSAGNPFRRWPEDQFVALTAALARETGTYIVLTSGPSDADAAARIVERARAALAPDTSGRVLACGDFSLAELRALVERAVLYIGGDSGPLHLAAASPVPIVGLYGPTLPARSAPWRDRTLPVASIDAGELPCRPCHQRRCEPGDFRCLTTIPAQRVLDAALKCLK